jgi:hypothetical protein
MIKLINRGFRKLSEFFKGNKELSDKCRKCKVIKPGGISPAIVFTERNISHEDCDDNCGVDNKAVFIAARIAIIVLVIYLIIRYSAILYHAFKFYTS